MVFLLIDCPEAGRDRLVAEFVGSPTIGITESEPADGMVRLHVFFPSRAEAEEWISAADGFDARVYEEEDEDWARTWRESWKPFCVGSRFFLVPEWMEDPAPEGRIRLEMHAGMAFGTGDHATTQMCLEALEEQLPPAARVADIGTGSGILCVAAIRLGAASAVGTDNDWEALEVAAERFCRERLRENLVQAETLCFRSGAIDFLLMNIGPQVVIESLPEAARVLAPGGLAVLTGFLTGQAQPVREAAVEAGLEVIAGREKGEWAAVIARRPWTGV